MKNRWSGKTRGNALGYKIFLFILKFIGLRPAYFVLRFVAFYFFLFAPSASRNSYIYFRKRRGYGRLKAVSMVYRQFFRFGQILLDKFALMGGFANRYHFTGPSRKHIKQLAADSQAAILLTAHVGNWEMAGRSLRDNYNTRINLLMYDGEKAEIKQLKESAVEKQNVHIITIKEDMSHVFEINRALKNKEFICIQGDRYMPGQETIVHEFMGKEAHFPNGPFSLATRLKIPVTFVFSMKDKGLTYQFSASEPRVYSSPQEMLQEFVSQLENQLAQYPEQWFNFYDFWAGNEKEATEQIKGQRKVPSASSVPVS
jgi:predicted LPLAT superfamily acyltransferase